MEMYAIYMKLHKTAISNNYCQLKCIGDFKVMNECSRFHLFLSLIFLQNGKLNIWAIVQTSQILTTTVPQNFSNGCSTPEANLEQKICMHHHSIPNIYVMFYMFHVLQR